MLPSFTIDPKIHGVQKVRMAQAVAGVLQKRGATYVLSTALVAKGLMDEDVEVKAGRVCSSI